MLKHLILGLDHRLFRMRITLRQLEVLEAEVEARYRRLSEAEISRDGRIHEFVLNLANKNKCIQSLTKLTTKR